MPSQTEFLKLTLPALNEFINTWWQPLNENFETIDDYLKELTDALVGTTGNLELLGGDFDSLAERLDVAIADDGTIDLSSSPDLAALASSVVYGNQATPGARFDLSDLEMFDARSPAYGDRFSITPTALGNLDVGLAHRDRDSGLGSSNPLGSPVREFVHGMVASANDALLSGTGIGQVTFAGVAIGSGVTWPIFNIDGFLFRVRESIVVDFANLGGLTNGDLVYLYVERRDYANASIRYRGSTDIDGNLAVKDLRTLQSGVDGVIGTGIGADSIFTSAGAKFSTAKLGQVLPGDELVITGGGAAGTYPIASVDSDTQIHVIGKIKQTGVSGQTWAIKDNHHPNIGVVRAGGATTPPAFQAGRAYIGECIYSSSGSPTSVKTYAKSGVYDSGWSSTITHTAFPVTLPHNLGIEPTSVEVWFRAAANGPVFKPLVNIAVVSAFNVANSAVDPSDPTYFNLQLPSVHVKSDRNNVVLTLINQGVTNPTSTTPAMFVDQTGVNVDSGQYRVIVRR